jgi:3-isopropylmalate dehydratase small subunit
MNTSLTAPVGTPTGSPGRQGEAESARAGPAVRIAAAQTAAAARKTTFTGRDAKAGGYALSIAPTSLSKVRRDGFTYRFAVDPFARECLVGGLDEIGLVERHTADIGAFESHRAEWLPAVR